MMKYLKPEIEIIDFSQTEAVCTDPIMASGYTPGENQTPIVPRNGSVEAGTGYWGNN
ncbi:MAG: hypothetical protein IJX50_00925 [Clostridia bacterium]|nr:hypothetical protein [Clostridia bacterium]